MLFYLLVVISTALFCLGLMLLKKNFFSFAKATVAQLDVMLDESLSEDDKQTKMVKRLGALLKEMLLFFILMFLALAVALVPVLAYLHFVPDASSDTSSIYFYIAMTLGSFVFFIPFKKKEVKSDYSDWSKLLHQMVLDNYTVSKALFKLEKKFFLKKTETPKQIVIVTGMARAGTTALTNMLHQTNKFNSLDYANMPFILATNVWGKFYKPKNIEQKERAHGDNVLFGLDSVEALEEYFYKTMRSDDFIGENEIKQYNIDEELYKEYLNYVGLINLKNSSNTYLAKNNNFILRYESVKNIDNKIKPIFLVRDPLQHAKSLLSQHLRFLDMQEEDPFVEQYMTWLAHHEFGKNHKPFKFEGIEVANDFETNNINYWLLQWINYHRYLLQLSQQNDLFIVHYLDFLEHPDKLLARISSDFYIDFDNIEVKKYSKKETNIDGIEQVLKVESQEIYSQLLQKCIRL